ncbi:hypothetical protein GIB67_014511 [Kingdonia uniflora]|uniref:DUF4283 domain-containing protein n=1 Tax=Kingdonia uniflora TaxID=39325 RepID=A0A7J7NMB5_9MAGN|nr:hypothetical protein GIB67_014511 [Kingdonia uniflora]
MCVEGLLDLTGRPDCPGSWSVRTDKIRTRQASRIRLIDEEVEENEASISGCAPMDEGSNLEVLDVVTDTLLAVVVPASGVSSTRRHKTVVTEDSNEEEIEGGERNKGNAGPSGGPTNRSWKNLRYYIDALLDSDKGKVQNVSKAKRAVKQAAPVHKMASDALRLRPRQVPTQTKKGKGKVVPESLRVYKVEAVAYYMKPTALCSTDLVEVLRLLSSNNKNPYRFYRIRYKVKLVVARSEALRKWNFPGNCQFIPLGKGYFKILLDNEVDKMRIWGGGPWHIDGQLLRVNIWTPDFDINKQKNTHAMVWVKFLGLGTEYWEEDVLMSIARTVGNPI